MTDPIILTIPEDISERARQIAQSTDQPVEVVLIDHLKTLSTVLHELPIQTQSELAALQNLSDDTLWTIAREQMPDDLEARAHELMAKRTLTSEEQTELDNLTERADRLMLRKAEAASILRKRGYTFTQQDFKPQHG